METFVYRCPECGFEYSVPAYWMSYSAEPTYMFPHMKPGTDDACECFNLEYKENAE